MSLRLRTGRIDVKLIFVFILTFDVIIRFLPFFFLIGRKGCYRLTQVSKREIHQVKIDDKSIINGHFPSICICVFLPQHPPDFFFYSLSKERSVWGFSAFILQHFTDRARL